MSDIQKVSFVFVGFAILTIVISLFVQVKSLDDFTKLVKQTSFKGIMAGIIASIAAVFLITVTLANLASRANANELTYFNYVEIDVGLLYTSKISPQCEPSAKYDKATSDLRGTLNFIRYSTPDGRFVAELNGDYLHHSCELGEDRNSFDGVGPKARLRFEF